MTEQIKVKPTPIQRNSFDVAMELLQHHAKVEGLNADEIEMTFAKYYALAKYCDHARPGNLQSLLSEELLEKVVKFSR